MAARARHRGLSLRNGNVSSHGLPPQVSAIIELLPIIDDQQGVRGDFLDRVVARSRPTVEAEVTGPSTPFVEAEGKPIARPAIGADEDAVLHATGAGPHTAVSDRFRRTPGLAFVGGATEIQRRVLAAAAAGPHEAERVATGQCEQVGFAKALQANLGTIGNRGQVLPRLASIRGADDERAVFEALPLRRHGGNQHAVVLELPVHGRQQAPIAEADDGVVGQWGFVGIAIVAGSPCDLGDEYDWHVDPQAGATVEARLKVASCSAPWGVALLVSDGVHEEGVTFYPDRVALAHARLSTKWDAQTAFPLYRIRIRGCDIRVWADDELLLDGTGKFTAPAHGKRNQIGFGCGSSTATGEAIWQLVRFQGGRVQSPSTATPQIPGLDVAVGNTQVIVPDKVYASMFKFADGSIAVDGKWTTDGGQSWQRGPAFHSGAYQFPDGEIVQLGFHSKATDRDGYFTVPLLRSTDSRRRAGSSSPARRRLRQVAPPRRAPSP